MLDSAVSSAHLGWLWVFLSLNSAFRKYFVPVIALVKIIRVREVCFLTLHKDRKDMIHHITQTAIAEKETQDFCHFSC